MGKLYLTIIHIWEKALNFPLMLEKPLIHDEFAIDDDYVDSDNEGSVSASTEKTPSKPKSKDDKMMLLPRLHCMPPVNRGWNQPLFCLMPLGSLLKLLVQQIVGLTTLTIRQSGKRF